jgi:4-hydroxythreonine-4-phosphate dehydrogenase
MNMAEPAHGLPRIAIATGDPAGIGPEVSLKAALDARTRQICRPVVVGDPAVLEQHARAAGLAARFSAIGADGLGRAFASPNGTVDILPAPMPEPAAIQFGTHEAAYGRAALANARRAIRAALAGEVDAVVAAPHDQTSIAAANIPFDGYPTFVARETGMDPSDVFLMLWFGATRIVHVTLHVGVAEALALITRTRIVRTIEAADAALKRLGIASPRIFVSGVNPHAGEGGLFGREEIDTIAPAIAAARQRGIDATGPFGCDTLFHKQGADAFVVMLHDQGHIAAKLLAPNAAAALTIGSPVLFSSVAHGSALDIAGKGIASPAAIIEAIAHLAGANAHLSAGSAN